ncbi:MAG: DUF2207 domain-containing protein [Clostridia bacterium]|nr:DUF2207 domain-containing protein [Clostridia bacterium]
MQNERKKINIICSIVLTLIIISFLLIPTSNQSFQYQIKNGGFDTSSILMQKSIKIEVGTIIISGICTMLLIIKSTFSIKSNQKGNYLRDTKKVIEPVLAETIIDGKMDTKNLVMTVLIDKIYKKNIIIDGNKLILKNRWEMREYEKEILDLIFDNCSSIDINHLDAKCIDKDKKEIVETYQKIKQLIKEELLRRELYKEHSIIKKVIQQAIKMFILITLIYISLPRLPWAEAYKDMLSNIKLVAIFTILIQLMVIGICFFCNIVSCNIGKKLISGIGIILIPIAICGICSIIFNILNGGLGYVVNLNIAILNTIVCIYLLKRLKREIVLTPKGKEECKKAKELKNYIIDYSLVNDKDVNSIEIWGEYLVYATAFGIPSKVTQRFGAKLEGMNIDLEKIESTLNFIY